MLLKNVITYRLGESINIEALENAANERLIQPCGPQEPERYGFDLHDDEQESALEIHGNVASLIFATDTKILPLAAVRKELDIRTKQEEKKSGRGLSRREKQLLKEAVEFDLMPKAFSRQTNIHVMIDTVNMLIHVGTPSHGKAENALSFIRDCVGPLKVSLLENEEDMRGWVLSQKPPAGFEFGHECHLSGDDDGKVKFVDVAVASEVVDAAAIGRDVEKIALSMGECFEFVLSKDSVMTKVKFGGAFREAIDDCEAESPRQERSASILIMANQLAKVINQLWPK